MVFFQVALEDVAGIRFAVAMAEQEQLLARGKRVGKGLEIGDRLSVIGLKGPAGIAVVVEQVVVEMAGVGSGYPLRA